MPAISGQPRFLLKSLGASRTAIAYAALCGGPAGVTPFAALWLSAHGAPIAALGWVIALPLMARTVLARPLALWASRFSEPWKPISLLCGVTALASIYALSDCGIWASIVAWWAICLSVGACTPLMDAATLDSVITGAESLLAKAKSVGAIAYMGANIAVGLLFERLGAAGVLIWGGLTSLIAAVVVPRLTLKARGHSRFQRTGGARLLDTGSKKTRTSLVLVIAAAAFIEASHGFHAIAMISWAKRGYDAGLSGILWAAGIAADIIFLMFMGSFRARIEPERLLVLAGLAAVVRWAGFAAMPALPFMFVLQVLHAFSFTATYLASVTLIHKLSNDERRLPAQTMNWAFSTGLGTGLSILCAGPLYVALDTHGYWVMSGIAAIGLVLAIASNLHVEDALSLEVDRCVREQQHQDLSHGHFRERTLAGFLNSPVTATAPARGE